MSGLTRLDVDVNVRDDACSERVASELTGRHADGSRGAINDVRADDARDETDENNGEEIDVNDDRQRTDSDAGDTDDARLNTDRLHRVDAFSSDDGRQATRANILSSHTHITTHMFNNTHLQTSMIAFTRHNGRPVQHCA